MKKIIILILLLIPFNIYALTYPDTYSSHVLVYDLTEDNILYEKDAYDQISIASLTKILTTITAIENINNLDKSVTYTNEMASKVSSDASIAGLRLNVSYTYRDLLYASMLPSGADATTALAISISGSIEEYVKKMNELASSIGMKNSHFVNVTGLDVDNHYSTLSDLLILLKYALNNPLFKEIYTTKEYTLSTNQKVLSTINTYNKYGNYNTESIIGSKTGFTLKAGLCMSSLSKTIDHDILIITTGAVKTSGNNNLVDTLNLISFVQENYNYQELISSNQLIKTIPVQYSNIKSYTIYNEQEIKKFLPNDYDKEKIRIEYDGLEELSFKTDKHIGKINYYYADELLSTEEVYLKEDIKLSIKEIIKSFKLQITIVIIFIILIIYFIVKRPQKRLKG